MVQDIPAAAPLVCVRDMAVRSASVTSIALSSVTAVLISLKFATPVLPQVSAV